MSAFLDLQLASANLVLFLLGHNYAHKMFVSLMMYRELTEEWEGGGAGGSKLIEWKIFDTTSEAVALASILLMTFFSCFSSRNCA